MRSASEPGSREEDTIKARCRDTGSEGGGYGARLSDTLHIGSGPPVYNAWVNMPAMRLEQRQTVNQRAGAPQVPRGQKKGPVRRQGRKKWGREQGGGLRSASEPGSREEDTIKARCRDTGSEGGGYGARLSDMALMYSIGSVDNQNSGMSAMRWMQAPASGQKKVARLEGRARPQIAGTNSRKEGTQQARGRRDAPAVLRGI